MGDYSPYYKKGGHDRWLANTVIYSENFEKKFEKIATIFKRHIHYN